MGNILRTARIRSKLILANTEILNKKEKMTNWPSSWVPSWVKDAEGEKWSALIWDEVSAEIENIKPGAVSLATKA